MSNASAQADLAECPFCQRQVDSELVMYGGKCPHCFGEIPGEEAPTDPGEAKKKAEHKAIVAKVQRGRTLPLLMVAMLPLVAVCAAVVILLKPTPAMPILNLDEGEFALGDVGDIVAVPAVVVAPTPLEITPAVKPGEKIAKVTPKDPKDPRITKAVDPTKVDFGSPGTVDHSGAHNGGQIAKNVVVDPTAPLTAQGNAGGLMAGPDVGITRRAMKGVTLTDDNLIIEMVKNTVKEQLPKLRYQCYEPLLKTEPDVAGSWLLNFTVKPDGSVTGASAVAKEGTSAHTKLESCIAQKVAAWPFQPIKAELPVAKSVGFKAS